MYRAGLLRVVSFTGGGILLYFDGFSVIRAGNQCVFTYIATEDNSMHVRYPHARYPIAEIYFTRGTNFIALGAGDKLEKVELWFKDRAQFEQYFQEIKVSPVMSAITINSCQGDSSEDSDLEGSLAWDDNL